MHRVQIFSIGDEYEPPFSWSIRDRHTNRTVTEAVLCTLLSKLRFELPKDKEIVWNSGLLASTSVRGDKTMRQQLPLVVSKV